MGSILLVELDPETRDRHAQSLRAAGHEVIVAATTHEALLRVGEGGIDVVVLDALDPRAGTVELARDINALPDAPPFVLMSGSPNAPEISARMGAAAFVPKPCDPADLVVVLERHAGAVRPVRVIDDFGDEEESTGPSRQFG